jgi:hypothetical protein
MRIGAQDNGRINALAAARKAIAAARDALCAADALLDAQASEGAPAAGPRYADWEHNPLGSRRAFLDAARAGRFATFKRSRRVTALWADVEAWIESRPRPARGAAALDDDRELLARAGVPLRARR